MLPRPARLFRGGRWVSAALVFAGAAVLAAAAPPGRPNVVLFLVDDLAFGDLACHGNPHARTPQIDAFARQAVELSRFYVSPVCAPTRASLLTGRYNFRTGVADVFGTAAQMDPAETTVAEVLREAGYATGIFGKWHLGDDPARGPNAQGFAEALVHGGAAMRNYFDPELFHNGVRQTFQGYCMDIFTDHAVDFIRRNRESPFLLYLPANLIHTPLQVPEALTGPFADLGLAPSTVKAYAMLRSVDASFGRVLAALRELGLERNTLVLFTSDNGPCSGSVPLDRHMAGLHGLKGTVYENGIRVPCFVRWPAGLPVPGRKDRAMAHVDVMPTLLDACGVASPAGVALDGRSFLPLLQQKDKSWPDRSLFLQWDSGQTPRRGHAFAVISGRWKLVQPCGMDAPRQQHIRDRYAALCELQGRGRRSIDGPPRYELYDLEADPGERHDLAAIQPARVNELRQEYERWFDDVARRWNDPTRP
jgi:arylsulfatase A-like enzyme